MLKKKEVFTIITPIPGFIPRQLAIDILHSHSEVITLNPLVLSHKPIPAPRDAASDEFYSTWYEITERIQYVPGLGKMGSGKISFNGCFHDMPWGLQTHIYAPMNVDLRNKYRIAGNQPGVEPPEPPEIGQSELGIPSEGLYLREDIEIKCNITVLGFVKAELKKAGKEMVQRIIKKAELLDAGVLQGMIEDGKLRTINPADRSALARSASQASAATQSPLPSPTTPHYSVINSKLNSPSIPYTIPRPGSVQGGGLPPRPGTASSQGTYSGQYQQQRHSGQHQPQELPGPEPYPASSGQQQVIMELPGDFYHPASQTSPRLGPPGTGAAAAGAQGSPRAPSFSSSSSSPPPPGAGGYPGDARVSSVSAGALPSDVSRPSSLQSDSGVPAPLRPAGGLGGARSPPPPPLGAAAGGGGGVDSKLATHSETAEEHGVQHRDQAFRRLDGQKTPSPKGYSYNPADYAKVSPQLLQLGHHPQPGQHSPGKMAGGYHAYGYAQQQAQQRYGY